MIDTRAQQNSLHTLMLLDIVKQQLVHAGRIDGPTEYFSLMLAGTGSLAAFRACSCSKSSTGFHGYFPRVHCPADMVHTEQSRQDSGREFLTKVLSTFEIVPPSL